MPLSKVKLDKEYTVSDTTINGEHFYQIRDFLDSSWKAQMIADVEAFKLEGSGELETYYGNTDLNMHQSERFQTSMWKYYFKTILDIVSEVAGRRVDIWTSWAATAQSSVSNLLENNWHSHTSDYALVYYLQNYDCAMGTIWRPEEGEEIMILGYENSLSFFTADWIHDGVFPKWRQKEFLEEHPRYVLATELVFAS